MAYEVTATRKRPQVFDSLVGQQFVVSTIKNSIEQGRIAHAYLFSGPRGVGKTSSARILAKALNCIEGPTPYPCGVCEHCKEITQGNATDVIEIDGASNTSVNDVRVIKDEVLFPPQSCRYKVYIIDEVHMLSASAFNALLKTIEEPPEYVIFIFATTETQKVPATIRSRCQQFHFQLIPLHIIKEVLAKTAQEMDVKAEDEALFWIAKEATGSMRDAYTLFDQVLSFSNGNITMQQIQDKLGLAGIDTLSSLFLAIWEEQPQQALSLLHTLLDAGISIEQCIKEIAEYIRTLLLIRRSITQEAILGIQMNRIPQTLHTAYSDEQLEAALDLFLRLYRDIRYSLNPRFELELAVSRLSRLKYLTSSVTLIEKMQQLKDELMSGSVTIKAAPKQQIQPNSPAKPEKTAIVEPQRAKIKEPEAPMKKELKPITRERLPEIIQQVAAERDPVGLILGQVVDVYQDENQLTFVFASAFALQNAKQNEQKLQQLIVHLSGYDGPVKYILEEKPEMEPKSKNDEIVQTIATVFRGEILQSR